MGRQSADSAEVIVIGAGLAGTIAATLLARAGVEVLLIDRDMQPQATFKVEQLAGAQIEMLARLSLLEPITRQSPPVRHELVARNGRIAFARDSPHYGFSYTTMVTRLREALPAAVRSAVGRIVGIATNPACQTVTTGSGKRFTCRLVVLATGSLTSAARSIPVRQNVLRRAHSTTFGFDMVCDRLARQAPPMLVVRPAGIRGAIDYLTIFPIGGRRRANLFTYWPPRDPRVRRLQHDPAGTLTELLPGLRDILGRFDVAKPVNAKVTDLAFAEDAARDGVVLVGDAFGTTCPATGTGMTRLLTDAERLAFHYVTDWATSPGMPAEKIARFYNDPVKLACDRDSVRRSVYMRDAATQPGWAWALHRWQAWQRYRLMALLEQWRRGRQPAGPSSVSAEGLSAPNT